jgi:hypothetical protein
MIVDLLAWASLAGARARRGLADKIAIKATPPAHAGSGYVFDFDGVRVIAQFIVWPSGATEASAIKVETGQRAYFSDAAASNMEELDREFDTFLRAVAQLESAEA